MATFLFDEIIFGPVTSRRLGVSLGINLLPVDQKICSFDCIYCECGLNQTAKGKAVLPKRLEVKRLLRLKLVEMQANGALPDVITFAGNGEPTLHPDFAGIVDDTLELRNELCPKARIAVLSNATRLDNPLVVKALKSIDDNILKLDSGLPSTIKLIDRPNGSFDIDNLVAQLKSFEGHVTIQTLFLKGTVNGVAIDNTGEEDLTAWLGILSKIKPKAVMIYTISRDTPFDSLKKVSLEQLWAIAKRVEEIGLDVQVSG